MIKLTIITACWGPENLNRVIETVDNQTVQGFEHIFINDNHPETRKVLPGICDGNDKRHWVDLHQRCHFFGAITRNIGIQMAFSYLHESKRDIEDEWICFLDTDNTWKPDHLESMIKTKESYPTATLIASDAMWVGANDKTWTEIRSCKFRQGGCDLGQFMYNTKLFRDYGTFHAHARSKQRFDFRLIKKIIEGEEMYRVAQTNKPTFILSYRKK